MKFFFDYFTKVLAVLILHIVLWNRKSVNCAGFVSFRLDDIQDYWTVPPQIAVMNEFKAQKTPITVGIISNYFGSDATITNYIKTSIQTSGWSFEVANHGWNHERFDLLNYQQQKDLLSNGVAKTISQLTPLISSIKTFINPYYRFNDQTLTALKDTGFTIMSSSDYFDFGPVESNGFYRWPIGGSTSNRSFDDPLIGVPASLTFNQIQQQLTKSGFASVVMHAREFSLQSDANAVNQPQILELRSLLQMVKNAGIEIVTIAQMSSKYQQQPSSSTTTTTTSTAVGTTGRITTSALTTKSISSTTSRSLSSSSSSSTTGRLTTNKITTSRSTSTSTSTSTTGSSGESCVSGHMRCVSGNTNQYQTCVWEKWYTPQNCASGLSCHPDQSGDYIYCY